ncbi:unnamed protein product [Rhizopus microsporus]
MNQTDPNDIMHHELECVLPRSSFSLPPIRSSTPSNTSIATLPVYTNEGSVTSFCGSPRTISTDSIHSSSSSISSDDDDENEISIAISGRKAIVPPTLKVIQNKNKEQGSLYEDIWMDSPIFREYLHTLETWLSYYLAWLEKVEQCRQLEIAYNKSLTLLYEQTKLLLNEPFYTLEECTQLGWIDKEDDDDDAWENEDVRLILPLLREHGSRIKETVAYYKDIIPNLRAKYIQLSSTYCATQKLKATHNNHKPLDEITANLYAAKRSLCKAQLEYVQSLYSLIRSTRELLNEKLTPLFEGLVSDKHRNIKALQILALSTTEFVYYVNSTNTSFEKRCNSEGLSLYIQEKLASYYRSLKSMQDVPLRPSSPIPFPFLNKPKTIKQSYNSIESLFAQQTQIFQHMSTRGYLLIKKRSKDANGSVSNTGKWERHYFYISNHEGHLKQYKNQSVSITIINLKHAVVQSLESEKRDYVIQISGATDSFCIQLQTETAKDFSCWLQALSSWNNSKDLRLKPLGSGGNRFLPKKSILSVESVHTTENMSTASYKSTSSAEMAVSGTALGHPIPISECSVNCSGMIASDGPTQFTGLFKIYKSCIKKLNCTSQHSGELCILYASLLEGGILHLQTEKNSNEFFHRPIHLYSLTSQDIYAFSDSVDHMQYCIAIRPLPTETYHLITCSRAQRDLWLNRLKHSCLQTMPLPRKVQSLTIRVGEGRKIQLKDSVLYCEIAIDQEIRALTGSLKKSATLSWREDFIFSDIAKINHGITVTIYSKNSKNDRDIVYGTVFIPADQLTTLNHVLQEDWYEIRKEGSKHRAFASLTGLGSGSNALGEVRVGILLEEHTVFSLEAYQPLINVLKEFHHDLIYDMARKTSDVQALARNLLRIYEGMGLTIAWIKSLIDYEVSSLSLDDANILFRGNSFFTKVIDNFMKMNGREFLEEALQLTIERICKSGTYIEVESSRIPDATVETTYTNCTKLFDHVRCIWSGIQRAKSKCPSEFRKVFGHLQSAIISRFKLEDSALERHHQVARYTCVSGFIFLRWICPAIISPKQFGLVQDHPDTNTCRTLTLIAKCLMTLASHNSTEQSTKELWIMQLNEFAQANTQNFMDFINYVSNADDQNDQSKTRPDEPNPTYFLDLPYELAQLSRWCAKECTASNIITKSCS